VDDGVCDCCDGSEERYIHCPDRCATVALAEKESLSKLTDGFKAGNKYIKDKVTKMQIEYAVHIKSLNESKDLIDNMGDRVAKLQALRDENKETHDKQLESQRAYTYQQAATLLSLHSMPTEQLVARLVSVFEEVNFSDRDVEAFIETLLDPEGREAAAAAAPAAVDVGVDHYGDVEAMEDDTLLDGYGSEYGDMGTDSSETSQDDLSQASEISLTVPGCVYAAGFSENAVPKTVIALCNAIVKSEADIESAPEKLRHSFLSLLEAKRWFQEIGRVWPNGGDVQLALERLYDALLDVSAVDIPFDNDLREATTTLRDLESSQAKLQTSVSDFERFSSNLNYFAVRNECGEARDGKFIYRVCIWDKVTQEEEGSASEVDLGSFESLEETENGSGATLKYRNGQHCHAFGPRSADVKVTCGATNVVISASEPSTCFYSFVMESPAACTDRFAEAHGIYIE
jgi:hypothetical protein